MAKPIRRAVDFAQFNKQLDDAGIDNIERVHLGHNEDGSVAEIFVRLGNNIDAEDGETFQARLEACETSKEVALVVLDYHPDGTTTADQQWELFTAHGGTADRLAALYATLTREQQDRLGKLRARR